MRQISCLFTVSYTPYEENQVCSSDQPLIGPLGHPKISPQPFPEKIFEAKMVIIADFDYAANIISGMRNFWPRPSHFLYQFGHLSANISIFGPNLAIFWL